MAKKREIDLMDALARMVQQPGSVTMYQPIEAPESKYTVNDLKGMVVNDGALFMVEDDAPETVKAEPVAPVKRGPVIDDGKIKALYTANWSIREIAAEMGISYQTVRIHLKQMGCRDEKPEEKLSEEA